MGELAGGEQAAGLPRPERPLRAISAAEPAHVGVDVPIETKFHAPGPRKDWVERPELVERLAGVTARLILVAAPAGFGKTTLVAQWRASAVDSRQFAWVSLDKGDSDPVKLWWCIMHALLRACPQLDGEEILRDLRGHVPDITGAVIPTLVNKLAAFPSPAVLVLDDYHVIRDPSCHAQITFLVRHLPASVQLVLMTRADPPLPLPRLRAAGHMAEFRARELCFTHAEAALLVLAVSGVELSEPDLDTLVERTEGWPAGLHLAGLSLRGHDSPTAFVRQFTGANKFIADFLAEEVLGRQPAAIRQLLIRTSVLGRFCAPLCDAVVGSANAAEILDVLERENLFIVPLDETRQWFRYHRLFAHVLHGNLARTEPGIVPVLHERASAWHRRSGSADEAIDHAIAAGDAAAAIDLIARRWYAYADSGQVATVRRWLRMLGEQAIAASPVAAHCAAWAAALSGDRESVRRWLPAMAASPPAEPLPDGMRSLESSVALLQGFCGFDGLPLMRDAAQRAAELESDPASPWYVLARTAFGFSLCLCGRAKEAERPLQEAIASDVGIPLVRLLSMSALSLAATDLGQPARAQDIAYSALSLASSRNLSQLPQASLAHAAAGAAYAAAGRPNEARSELEYALRSRWRMPRISPWATIDVMLRLTQVLIDLGDRGGATRLADEAALLLTSLPAGADALEARLERLQRLITGRPRSLALPEPLTDREVAVLQLLQGTLSLREIAGQLHLSANTIKTHAQAIYRKLGVSTRRDAIMRGREAGFL